MQPHDACQDGVAGEFGVGGVDHQGPALNILLRHDVDLEEDSNSKQSSEESAAGGQGNADSTDRSNSGKVHPVPDIHDPLHPCAVPEVLDEGGAAEPESLDREDRQGHTAIQVAGDAGRNSANEHRTGAELA